VERSGGRGRESQKQEGMGRGDRDRSTLLGGGEEKEGKMANRPRSLVVGRI